MSRRRRRHTFHIAAWLIAGFCGFWLWSGYFDHPAESTVIPLKVTAGPIVLNAIAPAAAPGKVLDLDAAKGHVGKHVSVVSLPIPIGKPTWLRNAVAVGPADGRPQIAIIIDDAGVNRRNTEKAIGLEAPLTISFLPYAHDLKPMVSRARANGHEIMVHLPMEPLGGEENPGPHALWVDETNSEILRRLDWNLDRFGGYVGVNNHMGSRFSADRPAMRVVLHELHRRGLLFIDSRTTSHTVGAKVAEAVGMPWAERDVFLDNDEHPAAIRVQLQTLEHIARIRGQAIAIGHPYDSTTQVLRDWLPTAHAKGFEMVPVSRIVEDKLHQEHLMAVAAEDVRP